MPAVRRGVDLHAQALASSAPVGELSSREVRAPRGELTAFVWVASVCWLEQSLVACTPTALDTVDLGDHPEAPELALDEQFFHCQIQPNVLTAHGCASGGPADSGGCHGSRSALRLVEVPSAPVCQADRVVGAPSAESIVNLERVRTSVGIDADSSPLYRRPIGLDSHPRAIFPPDSEAAVLLRSWLNGRGSP